MAITQQWPHYHDGRHRDDLGTNAHRKYGSPWIHQTVSNIYVQKGIFSIYVDHCIVCWIWSITYHMQYFMWLKKHVPYELWCIAYNKSNYYIHTKYKDKYVYFKYVSQSITLYLQKIWKNMSTRTRIHHMCVSEIGLACLSLAKYVNWVAFSWANSKLNWPGETSAFSLPS